MDIMNDKEILRVAMQQSAIDSNCSGEDFLADENRVVISAKSPLARKYLELPFYCDLVSYGNNVVASVDEAIAPMVSRYISSYSVASCFETPNLHILNDELEKVDMQICFMAEYFLPNIAALELSEAANSSCQYEIRLLLPEDFSEYYLSEWSNALCEKRKLLDVLAVGAFDGDRLVGLAGCSADCDTMWQIGIDVLPQYRRQGIACVLITRLAKQALQRGCVPFYCAAWSNVRSVRSAIKSGFRPAWVEVTAKSREFVENINKLQ